VGRPRNRAIAEWQLSRVYSVLDRAEPSMVHARRSLAIAVRARLAPFYVAYTHKALARAAAVARNRKLRNLGDRRVRSMLPRIREARERILLEKDLASIH
jgi:hypothetical protein